MSNRLLMSAFVIAVCAVPAFGRDSEHNVAPSAGYVPSAEVAIRIAVAVWEPIYGTDTIASERPYHAALKNGIWVVEGSLSEGQDGGVAVAEISALDARVLRISHGK